MDFDFGRSVYSKCTTLKFQPTWVTDMVVLPDVNVVCTSSTECQLRFYDISAKKFDLRLLLTCLDCAILTMCYYYDLTKPEDESKLVLGDQNGTVRIIFINPMKRGPFKSELGFLLRQIQWSKFAKNPKCIPHMRMLEFKRIHTDWVRKVAFYPSINCFISIANCLKQSMYISDMSRRTIYSFNISSGVYCMDFMDSKHIIVTGGSDCMIRIWNTFIQQRPNAVLSAHHAPIVILIFQHNGKYLFSMSQDRVVKIWNLTSLSCIQTFKELQKELTDSIHYGYFYNCNTHEVFIGLTKIVTLVVYGKLNPEETDGYTHNSSVSVILFNPLFKVLITCGTGSSIISWDPFTGTRLKVIKEAHVMKTGHKIVFDITAATFSPKMKLLLTGARDGSLKVWCFQTGSCIRKMSIEGFYEVTAVKWIPLRIFAMGWDKRVTEFSDTDDTFGCKLWDIVHQDSIICADIKTPLILATASLKGEIIFWRLDGSQPYKRFDVTNPTGNIPLRHTFKKKLTRIQNTVSALNLPSAKTQRKMHHKNQILPMEPITLQVLAARANKIAHIPTNTKQIVNDHPCAITAIRFLQTRPVQPDVGSVIVALENGIVQVYSHHSTGSFIKSFKATHDTEDHVTTCETDLNDEYLFTGTKKGYIKTWLIANYALPVEPKVFMPKYRLIFPFLWTDVIQCRAKRAVRNQPLPILCNSYRAHTALVTHIEYINHCQILCSSSRDNTVRLWTLSGKYINTLGTFQPWIQIPSFGAPPDNLPNKIPPDIKRIASWTTLKVFNSGKAPRTQKSKPPEIIRPLTKEEKEKGVYGKTLTKPLLGNHFKFPCRSTKSFDIQLDNSLPLVPIYCHLTTEPSTKEIQRIPSPTFLIERKASKFKNT